MDPVNLAKGAIIRRSGDPDLLGPTLSSPKRLAGITQVYTAANKRIKLPGMLLKLALPDR